MSGRQVMAIYRLALAAACMARGLSAKDAQQVHRVLAAQEPGDTVEECFLQVDQAISEVRNRRLGL